MKYTTEIDIYADAPIEKTAVELFGRLKAADGRVTGSAIHGSRARLTVESNGLPKVEKFRDAIPGSVAEYFAASEDGRLVSNVPGMVRMDLDAARDEIHADPSLTYLSTWPRQMAKDEAAERMAGMLGVPAGNGFDRLRALFQEKYPVRVDEYACRK